MKKKKKKRPKPNWPRHPLEGYLRVTFNGEAATKKQQYRWMCMQCLLHRYLYYIINKPFLTDLEYDRLELQIKRFEKKHGIQHPKSPTLVPGSTCQADYPRSIIHICERYYGKLRPEEKKPRQQSFIF